MLTGLSSLLVRRNARWILVFAFIFAYASFILFNASGLSQWYSRNVTEEVLGFAKNDFVVSQTGMPELAEEVNGRLAMLKDVRYVVSMVCVKMHLSVPGVWGGTLVYRSNGTGVTIGYGGISFSSFIGLENVLNESELNALLPREPGTAVLSGEIARALNISKGGDFKVNTPLGNMTFQVAAVTDLGELAIWNKIDDPKGPLKPIKVPQIARPAELFPAPPSFLGTIVVFNQLVLVSLEDAVNMCSMFSSVNFPLNPEVEILHYVFMRRENLVDALNVDVSVRNFMLVKERIEWLVSDVPAKVDGLALQCMEAASSGVGFFSAVAYGYMLAALPLYWFIASELVGIFAERKRREIALLRVKGMSVRKILYIYLTVVLVSASIGTVLSALIQVNVLNMLLQTDMKSTTTGTNTALSEIAFPGVTTFVTLLVFGFVLALLAVWKMVKSLTSLQPIEAAKQLPGKDMKPSGSGKLPIVLLALGLIKVGLVLGGLNPSSYFKYSPPNPYVAMAVGLFAAFDIYALTALAPVFIAYGFAKIMSVHSERLGGLVKAFSYLSGLNRKRISFRLISSEMWRTSAFLLLVALLISYGFASHVCNNSLNEHVWKMAGEFSGSDVRIDCLPNATQNIENTLKDLNRTLYFTRIDVATSMLIYYSGGIPSYFHVSFMVVDPDQYNRTAYLDNSPELRSNLAELRNGNMISLYGGKYLKDLGSEGENGIWYFPKADATFDTELYFNVSRWREITMQRWSDFPLPGTIENSEFISISYSLRTLTSLASVPDESVYPELLINELYQGQFRFQNFTALSQRMSNHVKEGSLWKIGEFTTTRETISSISHLHYKTHFIIKLKEQVSSKDLALMIRSRYNESALVITREEARDIITKDAPKIATGLTFTQINSILIAAVSFGGLATVTITNVAGRAKLFSLLRIRGAKKTDSVAFFIPEIALVSLMSVILGVMLGWTLAVGFTASLTYFIPPLFTGGPFQMVLGLDSWLFVVLILTTFAAMYIIATLHQQRIGRGAN